MTGHKGHSSLLEHSLHGLVMRVHILVRHARTAALPNIFS